MPAVLICYCLCMYLVAAIVVGFDPTYQQSDAFIFWLAPISIPVAAAMLIYMAVPTAINRVVQSWIHK